MYKKTPWIRSFKKKAQMSIIGIRKSTQNASKHEALSQRLPSRVDLERQSGKSEDGGEGAAADLGGGASELGRRRASGAGGNWDRGSASGESGGVVVAALCGVRDTGGDAAGGGGSRRVGLVGLVRLVGLLGLFRSLDTGEVGASNAGLVGEVDNNRKVSKVGWVAGVGRGVGVDVLLGPLLGSDVTVLSAQVASLARLGLGGIAHGGLATNVGVKVGTSASAVAVRRNGLCVHVVHEGATLGRQTRDGDGELDTGAVGVGGGNNRATNGTLGLLRQGSDVGSAGGVVVDGGRDSRGLGRDGRSRSDDREELETHFGRV
jgi:hypothetical protein